MPDRTGFKKVEEAQYRLLARHPQTAFKTLRQDSKKPMPDRTGFKKVDYAQGCGTYSTVEGLANAHHIAHQQDLTERANQRDGGDINQCRCETVTLRQVPHHQRNGDAAQTTGEVKHAAGKSRCLTAPALRKWIMRRGVAHIPQLKD